MAALKGTTHSIKNCYRCGRKLQESDFKYTHGKYWCRACTQAYEIEQRLKDKTTEEIRKSITKQTKILKIYKTVLEERILYETRQRRKEELYEM